MSRLLGSPFLSRSIYRLQTRGFSLPTSLGVGSHGSLRVVQEVGAPPVKIEILTGWEDGTSIVGLKPEFGMKLHVNKEDKSIDLRLDSMENGILSKRDMTPNIVQISTPEHFDVDIALHFGDIQVSGTKLNAENCSIKTANGSIKANKIRSHNVILDAPRGSINISSVIEATTMQMSGRAVHVKRVGAGKEAKISVDCSTRGIAPGKNLEVVSDMTRELMSSQTSVLVVNSMYAPNAFIKCVGTSSISTGSSESVAVPKPSSSSRAQSLPPMVLIDSMHGSIDIHVDASPSSSDDYRCALAVERITGCVQASVARGNIEAHFDVVEGSSMFRAHQGNMLLMVNQEALTRVNMMVEDDVGSNTTTEEEESNLKGKSATIHSPSDRIEVIEHDSQFILSSSSNEEQENSAHHPLNCQVVKGVMRPLPRSALDLAEAPPLGGFGKGKIDLPAAMRFNSSTSFFGVPTPSTGAAAEVDADPNYDVSSSHLPEISVQVSGGGSVKFESLSWKNAIKRKFGLF